MRRRDPLAPGITAVSFFTLAGLACCWLALVSFRGGPLVLLFGGLALAFAVAALSALVRLMAVVAGGGRPARPSRR